MPNWRTLARNTGRGCRYSSPYITLTRQGRRLYLNRAAVEALKRPPYLDVLYDPPAGLVGLHSALSDTGGFPVTYNGGVGTVHVSALRAVLADMAVPVSEVTHCPAQLDIDGTLIICLPSPERGPRGRDDGRRQAGALGASTAAIRRG